MAILAIGSDHTGYKLKTEIINHFRNRGYEVRDMGCNSNDSVDYPDYAQNVAQEVVDGDRTLGVLICSTGIGMSIAANRFRGVRAAQCQTEYHAQMSRTKYDANVLCLGARVVEREEALRLVGRFLRSEFEGNRHQFRLEKIEKLAS